MNINKRFTIRCAVYLFLIKANKLFLIQRKNTGWEDGKYGVPSGHLEENETVREAVFREAKEEAKIDIEKNKLKIVHIMHRKSNFDYIDLYFTIKNWKGEPTNAEEGKSDKYGWFSFDNLPNNTLTNIKVAFENYRNSILLSELGFS